MVLYFLVILVIPSTFIKQAWRNSSYFITHSICTQHGGSITERRKYCT